MRYLAIWMSGFVALGCGGGSDGAEYPKATEDTDPIQLVLIEPPAGEPIPVAASEEVQPDGASDDGEDATTDGEDEPEEEPSDEPRDDPSAAPSDVAAPPASAQTTSSGLAHRRIRAGTGTQHPTRSDRVEVHYAGWTTDGKLFDSSYQRGTTTQFPLSAVIKGWTEGVPLMVVGEVRRFWIPADLAYGPKTPGSSKPGGMLVFDVELLRINP